MQQVSNPNHPGGIAHGRDARGQRGAGDLATVGTGQRPQLELGDDGLDGRNVPALVALAVPRIREGGIERGRTVIALGGRDGNDLLHALVLRREQRTMMAGIPHVPAALAAPLDLGWPRWGTGRIRGGRFKGVAERLQFGIELIRSRREGHR
ncbi:MAG: hypothetical protein KatS3mg057_2068 [Herpetosiphonaceae bacterium]|nr:MAG: hypothetical protein KatS3mg057_2068 [Herpetosiphonaceae bacterium]